VRRVSADERDDALAMIERSMAIKVAYRHGWIALVCVDGSEIERTESFDDPYLALKSALTTYERVKKEELQSWLEH
jgi:hypothetical protein